MGKRRGRKGKSDAWKDLVRVHRRGPKRLLVVRPRRKDGMMPLANPEFSKRIQVVDKTHFSERRTGISVLSTAFSKLGLKDGGVYTATLGESMRALRLLKKPLEAFGHNDHVLGGRIREFKLENCVGKCVVLTGTIKNVDATIIICRAKQVSSPSHRQSGEVESGRVELGDDNESSDGWSSDEED